VFALPLSLVSSPFRQGLWGEKNKLEPDKLVICDITSVGDLMKFFNLYIKKTKTNRNNFSFPNAVSMETLQTDSRMAHLSSYKQTKGNGHRTDATVNLRAIKMCLPATVYISQHNIWKY